MAGHAHAAPAVSAATGKHWVNKLERMRTTPVMVAGVIGTCVLAGVFIAIGKANGETPITMSAEWKAAEKDYARQHNMNPIFGISSKK